jgi:UDP-glucose 4-epimerase
MLFDGKRVLITGGTGSLGQVLTRRVLSGELGQPRKVIVLSRDEAKQHAMRVGYLRRGPSLDAITYENFMRALELRIGDVRDYADVCSAVRDADIVINAAALKQVPTCEYFPEQAILTNTTGPINIARAIREHGYPVEAVVGISTDKACLPVNVMGFTKALQERVFVAANVLSPSTRFVCVRYGNVLASRGSVIPLFIDQIRQGGPVTVTEPTMTRFLLTLQQAVDTVFAALRDGRRGEILVPHAPAARIIDIAHALIGDRDVAVRIDGARPGEKMHETLVSEEECRHASRRGAYYAIAAMLPELGGRDLDEEPVPEELSSEDMLVSVEEVAALFKQHRLTVDDVGPSVGEELLR